MQTLLKILVSESLLVFSILFVQCFRCGRLGLLGLLTNRGTLCNRWGSWRNAGRWHASGWKFGLCLLHTSLLHRTVQRERPLGEQLPRHHLGVLFQRPLSTQYT